MLFGDIPAFAEIMAELAGLEKAIGDLKPPCRWGSPSAVP